MNRKHISTLLSFLILAATAATLIVITVWQAQKHKQHVDRQDEKPATEDTGSNQQVRSLYESTSKNNRSVVLW